MAGKCSQPETAKAWEKFSRANKDKTTTINYRRRWRHNTTRAC